MDRAPVLVLEEQGNFGAIDDFATKKVANVHTRARIPDQEHAKREPSRGFWGYPTHRIGVNRVHFLEGGTASR
jgi:hypothetical protein